MKFYDSIKLEKGMYDTGFTKTLEALDPSEAYYDTDMAGLDAYERQLKRFNIKVKGQNSDVVESFFKSTDSAVLFPEFVRRSVLSGMDYVNTLSEITAAVTIVDNNDYRTVKSVSDNNPNDPVSEGNAIPKTIIQTKTNLVTMKKRGRVISTTYEALRHKRLDLFAVTLRRIGIEIATAQLSDAVSLIITGDDSNPAPSVTPISATGIAYADLIKLWANLAPFEMNAILANTTTMQKLLALTELKEAQAVLNIQCSGRVVTPLGATLYRADSMSNNVILGLDRSCTLEKVQVGDLLVDHDKFIDKQLESAAISSIAGFAKIYDNSAKKMTFS